MKNSFVRNSFVVSRNLAFRDKARKLSRKGADSSEDSPMVFEYDHGAPSYPADVLPDGYRRGCIPPIDDGTPPESQVFDVAASGSVDDQAVISVSGGNQSYVSDSGAGVPIAGSIRVTGAGYHDVSVVHINIAYPPKGNISFIHCSISGIGGANPAPEDNEPESSCEDTCSCPDEGQDTENGDPDEPQESRRR